MARSTDMRIEDISCAYEEFIYRTPIKFGGIALDRATNLNVTCVMRTVSGRVATGFGSMPLGQSHPLKAWLNPGAMAMKSTFRRASPV